MRLGTPNIECFVHSGEILTGLRQYSSSWSLNLNNSLCIKFHRSNELESVEIEWRTTAFSPLLSQTFFRPMEERNNSCPPTWFISLRINAVNFVRTRCPKQSISCSRTDSSLRRCRTEWQQLGKSMFYTVHDCCFLQQLEGDESAIEVRLKGFITDWLRDLLSRGRWTGVGRNIRDRCWRAWRRRVTNTMRSLLWQSEG